MNSESRGAIRAFGLGLCGLGFAAGMLGGAADAVAAERPAYRDLRYEEDWSALADPAALPSSDPFDPIKHVALTEDGSVWLSLGGQLRERVEVWDGFAFGAPRDEDATLLLSRARLHADLHVGSHLRLFVEGKSSLSTDTNAFGGARRGDVDTAAFQNAFLELAAPVGAEARLALRLGRQELLFAAQRLVGPLDWGNARRTFDGAVLELTRGGWTTTLFATQPVRQRPHDRNDRPSRTGFVGVHATGTLPIGTEPRLDLYAYELLRDDVLVEGTTGDERRYTFGARVAGRVAGTRFDYDLEAAAQSGRVGRGDVRAYMVATQVGYWISTLRLSPRFFVGFDFASGDQRPGGDVELFNQLFPTGHAFLGAIDAVGRQNVVAYSGGVAFRPLPALSAQVAVHRFARADTDSGLYNAGGGLLRAGTLSASRSVGSEIDVTGAYRFDPHTVLGFGYAHFFPDDFVEHSGASDSIDFGYVLVQYTF